MKTWLRFAPPISFRTTLALPAALASTIAFAGEPATLKTSVSKVTDKLKEVVREDVQAYETNQLGFTHDEGNDAFMDFTVSLMIPATRGIAYPRFNRWKWRPFGAATFRSGQYLLSRSSSPVVGKRFNPVIGIRFGDERRGASNSSDPLPYPYGFLDVVYGHESNGQSIASPESFQELRATYVKIENDADKANRIARDNISRGWDYVGLRREWHWRHVSLATTARVYLSESIPQGEKEEYKAWENDPEGKPRQKVDGFTANLVWRPLDSIDLGAAWTTGLQRPMKFHTVRAEAGYRLSPQIRLFIWGRNGYNSDLVNYYKRNVSLGVGVSFWDPPPIDRFVPPTPKSQ